MRRLTASQLQRIFTCPASAALPAVIEQAGEAAQDGNDIHAYLYRRLKNGNPKALVEMKNSMRGRCAAIDLGALQPFWKAA